MSLALQTFFTAVVIWSLLRKKILTSVLCSLGSGFLNSTPTSIIYFLIDHQLASPGRWASEPIWVKKKRKIVGWEEKMCDTILLAMTQIICLWPTPAYLRDSNENCVVSFYKGQFKMRRGRSNTAWAAPGRFLPRHTFSLAPVCGNANFLFSESFPFSFLKRPHLSVYANWAKQELETLFPVFLCGQIKAEVIEKNWHLQRKFQNSRLS